MNRADPAWSYSDARQRSRPFGETTFVTIYTASESRLFTPLMEEAQAVGLDLFESAYRQGVERAEELCRQCLEDRVREPQAIFLKIPARSDPFTVIGSPGNSSVPLTGSVVKRQP